MTDAVVIAVLAFVGVLGSAFIAGGITLSIALARWHRDNRLLWLWNRQLVDHIYHGSPPPPPPAPPGLFE
ncbi:hypothetical protein [Agromyces sp. S2-1-8]|uniref:hypothetical protein n=1 Tax=Agromyces sp. S2-1-8 TaxID=2897180 RepID=UPI001E400F01|nr:hypothetical protein [Agromyces sp. S2-1-8]MCD5345046.1 hypothetical protein [Agromyces sp. S2-1-8]